MEYDLAYVWGFDCTEKNRAARLDKSMPGIKHICPLIDKGLTKEDCHGMLERMGIKRPIMYELGFKNNNCIMCVKSGMYSFNLARKYFPEQFEARAKLEREIGHSCLKGIFLDELDPNAGRKEEIEPECGIMCLIAEDEATAE